MSEYAITLEGIDKSFTGVKVLDNVTFKLRKGTIHALVGGNGAGKSTLMKILTGVYSHDRGVIRLNDVVTRINTYSEAIGKGISLIFQDLSLIPTLSIMENIYLAREIKRFGMLDKEKMKQNTKALLEKLRIDLEVHTLIQDLDIGACRMIEIAKALSVNASIMIMDEPTASLSEKETSTLFNIIRTLKASGVSIIYISHRMNEILEIADEVTVLRNGRIVACKKAADYTMESLISDIMGEKEFLANRKHAMETGDETVLEVTNLCISNKLHDVSFQLKRGEVLGFAGLLGSGRTEVLEAIFGIRNYDSGTVAVDGKIRNYKNVDQAIRDGIVLIPEDRKREGLVVEHTVRENVVLPNLKSVKKRMKIRKALADRLVRDCISEFNIKTSGSNASMDNLSGGNQQKVVIAKWRKTEPRVLMMDEPTVGIDIGAKGEIIELIRSFASQRKSVIFVSSELSELMAVCDRILIFKHGEIIDELRADEIDKEEILQHAIQR